MAAIPDAMDETDLHRARRTTTSTRLHSLCTYLGAFPKRAVEKYILALSEEGEVILDPFCGSGTTVLSAQELGRTAIGVDNNPLAYVLTKAKGQRPVLDDVLSRIEHLSMGFEGHRHEVVDLPDALAPFFHPHVFSQLHFMKAQLDDSRVDNFLKAVVAGILHGRSRRSMAGSIYLSVDMPNTFSMSSTYVRRYVKEHGLSPRVYDVFANCRRRSLQMLAGIREFENGAEVYLADSTQMAGLIGASRVNLTVTSPPYLGLLRYGAFNWLRLWFLNSDAPLVDKGLDTTSSLERYESFMLSALSEIYVVSKPGAHAVLLLGKLRGRSASSLAELLASNIVPLTNWKIVGINADVSIEDAKMTRIWGDAKRGRASTHDEVLILRKPVEHLGDERLRASRQS